MHQDVWDCVKSPDKPIQVFPAVFQCKHCESTWNENDPEPYVILGRIEEEPAPQNG